MTSVKSNGGARREKAHRWSHHHGTEPRPVPEPDPVHPQPRPVASAAAAPGAAAAAGSRAAALAVSYGTPAVLGHRVVALRVLQGPHPLRLHTVDEEVPLIPLEARVWARAGRLTVISEDGSEHRMTVLGADEAAELHLGDRWPRGEPDSTTRRAMRAAAHDVGHMLTFPAWLNRTTRLSGRRNVAMHGLVRRLRKASPDTTVYYGQTVGFEHPSADQQHPYDHRGIVGREGYPTEL